MPWKGVTLTERRERFLEDKLLNYYSITELAERFCISRKTAYKWIKRFKLDGQIGRFGLLTNKIQGIVSKIELSMRRADLVSRVKPMSLE